MIIPRLSIQDYLFSYFLSYLLSDYFCHFQLGISIAIRGYRAQPVARRRLGYRAEPSSSPNDSPRLGTATAASRAKLPRSSTLAPRPSPKAQLRPSRLRPKQLKIIKNDLNALQSFFHPHSYPRIPHSKKIDSRPLFVRPRAILTPNPPPLSQKFPRGGLWGGIFVGFSIRQFFLFSSQLVGFTSFFYQLRSLGDSA